MNDIVHKCKICKFYAPSEDIDTGDESGICRRFPPILALKDELFDPAEDQAQWLQPLVRCYDWCGEYKLKECPLDPNNGE